MLCDEFGLDVTFDCHGVCVVGAKYGPAGAHGIYEDVACAVCGDVCVPGFVELLGGVLVCFCFGGDVVALWLLFRGVVFQPGSSELYFSRGAVLHGSLGRLRGGIFSGGGGSVCDSV